jgi:peptide methionine sulfoxide reductase msrA/msrB
MKKNDASGSQALATFAGGCFWCVEAAFEPLDGVIEAVSGYTGGEKENPTYEEVSSGKTGHLEAVQVRYDPSRISYQQLLDEFWMNIDPTDTGGQFADSGSQYRTAIFYHDEEQRKAAEESRRGLAASGRYDKPIATEIRKYEAFYPAEDYHQGYYKKHPGHYGAYKKASGRGDYIRRMRCGI